MSGLISHQSRNLLELLGRIIKIGAESGEGSYALMRPKQLDRYSFIDAYILEGLRQDYTAGSSPLIYH